MNSSQANKTVISLSDIVPTQSSSSSSNELAQLRKILKAKNAQLEDIHRRNEETVLLLSQEIQHLKMRLDLQPDSFKAELEALHLQNERLAQEVERARGESQPLRQAIAKISEEMRVVCQRLKEQGDVFRLEALQADEARELAEARLQDAESRLAAESSKRRSAEETVARAEQEAIVLRRKITATEAELAESRGVIDQLKRELTSVRHEVDQVKEAFRTDPEIARLQSDLAKSKTECDQLSARVAAQDREIAALKDMNGQLKQMNTKYFGAMRSLQQAEQTLLAKERQIRELKSKMSRSTSTGRPASRSQTPTPAAFMTGGMAAIAGLDENFSSDLNFLSTAGPSSAAPLQLGDLSFNDTPAFSLQDSIAKQQPPVPSGKRKPSFSGATGPA